VVGTLLAHTAPPVGVRRASHNEIGDFVAWSATPVRAADPAVGSPISWGWGRGGSAAEASGRRSPRPRLRTRRTRRDRP